MMDFRTPVTLPQPTFSIHANERMLCVGSCFADNIGKLFIREKFRATVNPYGVMYNPASVSHTVGMFIDNFKTAQTARTTAANDMFPRVVVITLGTNHVYILNSTGTIVDNCAKRPQRLFTEKELSVDECSTYISQAVLQLTAVRSDVRIILTVSPIRYAKYGFHGSQLSKAVLLLAASDVESRYKGIVEYFPAYEIVNDELRDYRFYAPDMIHPSQQAVEYIYERFADAYFADDTKRFIAAWTPLRKALEHRPFDPDSADYKSFIAKTWEDIDALALQYPAFEKPQRR